MFGKNKSMPYGIEQATAELDAIIEKASEAFVLRRSTNRSVKHAFEPSLFEPKSPLPGNGIFKPETNGPKRRRSSRRGDWENRIAGNMLWTHSKAYIDI
jgi:hypothetical protein